MRLFLTTFLIGIIGLLSIVVISHAFPQIFVKAAYALVKSEFSDVPEFSSQEVLNLFKNQRDNHVIVDVRTLEEKNVSIIEASIDQLHFENNIDSYKNKKIIIYCTIGYRSGYYARTLIEQGLDAYNLSEGILGWILVGGKLVDPDGQLTIKIHVYSRPWNLAVNNHIAIF